MRIVDAQVNVCCPGRNFVTLKITTEDGVYGLGDATLNGRELAVASYLRDHVAPLLIGRDARRIEDTWQYLYKGAYWRRGPVTMTAICGGGYRALGHSRARRSNTPVYQLLGGASRESVLIYGHANGDDDRRHRRGGRRVRRAGLPRDPRAVRRAGHAGRVRRRARHAVLRAGGKAEAARDRLEHRAVSRRRAAALRSAPARVRAGSCTCFTTCITGSRRSKRRGSARRSSRITCSGSRIPSPRSCRKASG